MNVLALPAAPPVSELAAAGVRRVPPAAPWPGPPTAVPVKAGRELLDAGTTSYFAGSLSWADRSCCPGRRSPLVTPCNDARAARTRTDALLLGEWACLGILAQAPAHGYDVSVRLGPDGDIGRVWGLSRSLTYRALDQLAERGLIVAVAEERGPSRWSAHDPGPHQVAGPGFERGCANPSRTSATCGANCCSSWCCATSPVWTPARSSRPSARRSPLSSMPSATARTGQPDGALGPSGPWRYESSQAVLRFLDRMLC